MADPGDAHFFQLYIAKIACVTNVKTYDLSYRVDFYILRPELIRLLPNGTFSFYSFNDLTFFHIYYLTNTFAKHHQFC